MDRCALFVDASYVLADGALAVHGTRNRDSVSWDYAGLLKLLGGLSRDRTGLPLLRCYWYDTAADGDRAAEHDTLADVPGVKLRLSKARPNRKEGVEAEIRKDLTALARNRAVSDVIIVSGEEDLAPVIAEVQDLGIRTILLHIAADGDWAMSRALRQECDDIIDIAGGHLRPYVDLIPGAEPELAVGGYREMATGVAQISSPHQAADAPAARLYGSPLAADYDRGEPQLVGLAAAGGGQREQLPGQDAARFAAQPSHSGTAEGMVSGQGQRTGDPHALSQQYQPADPSRGQLGAGQAQGGFAPNGFAPHDSANGQVANGQVGHASTGISQRTSADDGRRARRPGDSGTAARRWYARVRRPGERDVGQWPGAEWLPANGLAQNGMPASSTPQVGPPPTGPQHGGGIQGGAGPQSQGPPMPPSQPQGMQPNAQAISAPGQHSLQRQGSVPGLPPGGLQPPGHAPADQQRQQQQLQPRQLPAGNGMQYPQDRGGQ